MSLLPHGSSLRSILDFEASQSPDEFLQSAGLSVSKQGIPAVYEWIRHLHTRLHLYGIVFHGDASALPEDVQEELRQSELLCLSLLVHSYWRVRSEDAAWLTLQEVVSRGITDASQPLKTFLAEQALNLVIDSLGQEKPVSTEEICGVLHLTPEQKSVFNLAELVVSYDELRPQGTIHALRKLAEVDSITGIAARFLLARVYQSLLLPLEEQRCLTECQLTVEKVYDVSLGEYAASRAATNPEMEGTVLLAARRLIELLRASDSSARIDALVSDLEKFGYGSEFSKLRSSEKRLVGVDLCVISRDDVANAAKLRKRLADALLGSARQQACFVLRDDLSSEVDTFQLPRTESVVATIIERLATAVTDASVAVHAEIVDEGVLEQRKWVLCYDQAHPIDTLAIGVMAMERESSVVYARALLFDTRLDMDKASAWFEDVIGVLGRPFDAQKHRVVREAVRRIIEQASAGHSAILVEEL